MAATVLRWAPVEFWAATPHELFAALDAWVEVNNPEAAKDKERRRAFRALREAHEARES